MKILFSSTLLLLLFQQCNKDISSENTKNTTDTTMPKHTNLLINETSPYLLQHAHNPVNWYPWGEEALEKAKKENKLIIISIGYSACHWCHVMEHESFEDEEVAKLMNEYFVCIKVDREERPDIDQIYMTAVQLMTGSGGWPLNCFALPDGRPVYGGTYFPKKNWMHILQSIQDEYKNNSEKFIEYATNLTEGIRQSDLIDINTSEESFSENTAKEMIINWQKSWDIKEGGPNRAPKFPIPNNYEFLLQYTCLNNDEESRKHLELTLDKMAMGGIYDQIGGGFARYSTDALWKIPHFEKMLYDNAQLVSLYSQAFAFTKKEEYKRVVEQTLEFVKRELTDNSGAFYSALDADSEGEEGKYYVWKKEELEKVLGEDYSWVKDYYNINPNGFWEHNNYILLRRESDVEFAKKKNWTLADLNKKVDDVNLKLLNKREKRIKPGLDDKTLTSWNALMLKGYAEAYQYIGNSKYLDIAIKNAAFIQKHQLSKDGKLFHSYKNGKSSINGFLEDYSFTIEAFLKLYEVSFDEKWLNEAKKIADYTIKEFYDEKSGMFYFTANSSEQLITRKFEISDNVIPASNSSIAKGLFLLGKYFDDDNYLKKSEQMLKNMIEQLPGYAPGYSNWGTLLLWNTSPFYEIVIAGKSANKLRNELSKNYYPNLIYLGTEKESNLSLLENKFVDGETRIYVCIDKSCKLPTNKVEEAKSQIIFK